MVLAHKGDGQVVECTAKVVNMHVNACFGVGIT